MEKMSFVNFIGGDISTSYFFFPFSMRSLEGGYLMAYIFDLLTAFVDSLELPVMVVKKYSLSILEPPTVSKTYISKASLGFKQALQSFLCHKR